MIKQNIVIDLPSGLQAKKAAEFVEKASSVDCNIFILKDEKTIEAKSIIGIMSAAIRFGEEITLVTDGCDEQSAIKVLASCL
ncbi:HPr family phosphocarrier protein [Neobacillus sp. NPDC093182]|uniref:HPr family phosphocarrier protein n=1 Tax=Neobacillus sp. NPDC093182 TaxID=3364297 RepID=UPI003820A74F